ncbi:MAG TPA: hypothetical protein VIH25_10500 [Steroidobacteraceae bacterium]
MTTRDTIETNLNGTGNVATAARTRYRDQALNWIALGILLGAWQLEAELDRDEERQMTPRLAVTRPAHARESQALWNAEPRGRSWISRATKRPTRMR